MSSVTPVSSSPEGSPLLPFRAIIDAATDGVAIIELIGPADSSPRFSWRYLNPHGRAILGLGESALDRVDIESTSPGLAHHGILQQCAVVARGEASARWALEDGRVLSIRAGSFDGYIVLRFRDVTSTEQLAESERESRGQLQAILASINDPFIMLDQFWRLAYLNAEAALILGRPLSELRGRNIWEELPFLLDTDFERELLRSSRDNIDVMFEARHPIDPDILLFARAYPSEVGLTVRMRDVSAERRITSQAAEVQRAKSLVTLAGGIAHDFNNLLTVLQGYAQLLTQDLGPQHPSAAHLEEIHGAAARAEDLTRQLLAYSQHQMVLPTRVDLNSVVVASSARLRNRAGESVTVIIDLEDTPVTVEVDPQELIQSVAYLVDNARDAMPEGGNLVIQVTRASIPGTSATAPILPAGNYGVVTLTDTGSGMTTDVRSRVTEPFFTHDRSNERSGLGLSAADGMAKQAGGWLELYSEVGVGTVVRIFLPCLDSDSDEAGAPSPTSSVSPGDPPPSHAADHHRTRSVLVVDDNTSVRDLVARLLSNRGYSVQTAADGPGAIALAAVSDTPFDVLVTDIVMPGLSGFDLAAAMVVDELGPAVLFMSGFTDRAELAQSEGLTVRDFIAKPFTAAEMLEAVERLLAERDARLGPVAQ